MVDQGVHHKEELVKDVASFANALTGGLLIIGFKTSTANAVETVSEVNPVPRERVNVDTYRKLIDERVFPQIQGLRLDWIDRGDDKVVLSIDIPAQPHAARPFVIPAPTGKNGSSSVGIAIPVRRGDRTVFWSPPEAHRHLSAGWMVIGAPSEDEAGAPETAKEPAAALDRAKAQRILTAVSFEAQWLRSMQSRPPMRRVRFEYTQAVGKALDDLRYDDVAFIDSELARMHDAFLSSLDRLNDELGGMFPPEDGPSLPVYVEVPPEWKISDRQQYEQALADLSAARDDFLKARADLMNALNLKGLLS
ncbi:hypothetical protein [Streptomyces sp. NPDC002133]|uniref:AlbA family DNA-binding domain-containing protein n=1 Tax=Streptomyces sp. NPDC002133 TaxID=3154409 RepID=UPI00332D1DB6